MKKIMMLLFTLFSVFFMVSCAVGERVRMSRSFRANRVFGSNMVVQRGVPVVIYGTAEPGTAVKVEFAGSTAYAKAGKNGEWEAPFSKLKAGGPYTLRISGEESAPALFYRNILSGDVWFCAGGENMKMTLAETGISDPANYPRLRLFNAAEVPVNSPDKIRGEPSGSGWRVCDPASAAGFSAEAFFFGKELLRNLEVPIGLISVGCSGSRETSWISEEAFRGAGRKNELRQLAFFRTPSPNKTPKKSPEAWYREFHSNENPNALDWRRPGYDDSKWRTYSTFNTAAGAVWFRRNFELPPEWSGRDLILELGVVKDCDTTFFNGHPVGSVGSVGYTADNPGKTVRNYRIPSKFVRPGTNTVAVRNFDYSGGGGLKADPNRSVRLLSDPSRKLSLAEDWKYNFEFIYSNPDRESPPVYVDFKDPAPESPAFPSTLFNGMVAPWTRFPVRGVVWDYTEPDTIPSDLNLLVRDWRGQWRNSELPFLAVQMPGREADTPRNRLKDDYWKKLPPQENPRFALIREAQEQLLNLPGTALAVSMDLGDHSDYRPWNKRGVGLRLAAEALRIAYGRNKMPRSPVFRSVKYEDGKLRVFFDHAEKGLALSSGKRPGAFAVGSDNGNLVWADAEIDGSTVLVSSPLVKNPSRVRYGFANYRGDLNLCGKDGMPVMPFRSDKK